MRKKKTAKTSSHRSCSFRSETLYFLLNRFHARRIAKGTRERCTGMRIRPQYQEALVKSRSDAANAAGYAYISKVFFSCG